MIERQGKKMDKGKGQIESEKIEGKEEVGRAEVREGGKPRGAKSLEKKGKM